jgi:hypothetical protein
MENRGIGGEGEELGKKHGELYKKAVEMDRISF